MNMTRYICLATQLVNSTLQSTPGTQQHKSIAIYACFMDWNNGWLNIGTAVARQH